MSRSAPACRSCGATDTRRRGRLPDVDVFAGQRLEAPLPGGFLHECRACGLVFRDPVLADADYAALYARGSTAVWAQNPDREDYRRVRASIPQKPLAVLDVGCYTGDLLATLPASCRLFGVEPNPEAAALAASRGVEIVAPLWNALAHGDRCYDMVIACDVIEHMADPLSFLSVLSRRLKPAGELIITTGNAQAWPWRLAGSRFWYCYFPEHISFVGPNWLSRLAPSAGLRVQRIERFSHSPLPGLPTRAKSLLATFAGIVAGTAGRQGPARLLGGGISNDHIFCVLRKG